MEKQMKKGSRENLPSMYSKSLFYKALYYFLKYLFKSPSNALPSLLCAKGGVALRRRDCLPRRYQS